MKVGEKITTEVQEDNISNHHAESDPSCWESVYHVFCCCFSQKKKSVSSQEPEKSLNKTNIVTLDQATQQEIDFKAKREEKDNDHSVENALRDH